MRGKRSKALETFLERALEPRVHIKLSDESAHAHTFRRNRLASQTEKGKFVDPAEDEMYFGDVLPSAKRAAVCLRAIYARESAINYAGLKVLLCDLLSINLRLGCVLGICGFNYVSVLSNLLVLEVFSVWSFVL